MIELKYHHVEITSILVDLGTKHQNFSYHKNDINNGVGVPFFFPSANFNKNLLELYINQT